MCCGKDLKEMRMLYTQQNVVNHTPISSLPSDHGFNFIQDRYRSSGGIANANELAYRQFGGKVGDMDALAKLILVGEIFSFEWQGNFWIPLFQFNPNELTSRHCVRQILGELTSVFDGWTLAIWFVQTNLWLEHKKPIDLLDSSLSSVLNAARADRYVAVG